MTRRYVETIEVRRRDDRPEQFLWRERLYLVSEVLGHWLESRSWWEPGAASGTSPVDPEQEVWRVEASPGRASSSGVYDLRFDWASGRWALSRVVD